jgi:hypothetical protein
MKRIEDKLGLFKSNTAFFKNPNPPDALPAPKPTEDKHIE